MDDWIAQQCNHFGIAITNNPKATNTDPGSTCEQYDVDDVKPGYRPVPVQHIQDRGMDVELCVGQVTEREVGIDQHHRVPPFTEHQGKQDAAEPTEPYQYRAERQGL